MAGPGALLRTLALRAMRGNALIRRYAWIYRWKPE
jgi:hypothetical protein